MATLADDTIASGSNNRGVGGGGSANDDETPATSAAAAAAAGHDRPLDGLETAADAAAAEAAAAGRSPAPRPPHVAKDDWKLMYGQNDGLPLAAMKGMGKLRLLTELQVKFEKQYAFLRRCLAANVVPRGLRLQLPPPCHSAAADLQQETTLNEDLKRTSADLIRTLLRTITNHLELLQKGIDETVPELMQALPLVSDSEPDRQWQTFDDAYGQLRRAKEVKAAELQAYYDDKFEQLDMETQDDPTPQRGG